MRQGLIHIYTGNGKGKTTAAFGLALRASGAGLKVIIFQFMKGKGKESSEVKEIRRLGSKIKVVRFREVHPFFVSSSEKPDTEKKLNVSIKKDLKNVCRVISSNAYDMVILDEIIGAVKGGFLSAADILQLMETKPSNLELVLTGRGAPPELIEKADYVTEMKVVKHPYHRGIRSRKGVEK